MGTAGHQRPKRLALLFGGAMILAAMATVAADNDAGRQDDRNDHGNRHDSYAIGLWGDVPYSDLQATVGVPNLLADMNRQDLAFTAHNGDLKAGSGTPGSLTPTTCSDALYEQTLGYFRALRAPAVFTPGDNDWTDCDRLANGGFNSLERLEHERDVFFRTPFTLGQRRLRQRVQNDLLCLGEAGMVACVENRMWTLGDVTYVTLNIQGSCNNRCDTAPNDAEWAARNHANILWMREAFELARTRRSAALMLISQANPGWDETDPRANLRHPRTLEQTDGLPDGFHEFLLALREEVIAFRRPVAYVHGDSHYFRIDKPFLDAQGRRLENFTRIETFGNNAAAGNNEVQWLKVLVNARSREVFAYQPQIVPGNRTAVPAP
jgi:hypothetical protein